MAAVEILNISVPTPNYKILHGGNIDDPKAGQQYGVYRVEITGWVLGQIAPAVAVELITSDGAVVAGTQVDLPRPDIATAFPDVEGAGTSGFRLVVNTVNLKQEFELAVRVLLSNGSRLELARTQGRRIPVTTQYQTELTPLLVTTLGRTGSSWLMLLLAQHPRIAAYRPFEMEPRVASYWLSVFRTLSEPVSYLRMLSPDLSAENWWTGQDYPDREKRTALQIAHLKSTDSQLHQWFGKDHIESLAGFAQERIESFYKQVAVDQGKANPAYFAEKHWPDNFIIPTMRELYPQAREVFLVRDFRDVICSVLAFNKKLGYPSFGREFVDSDEAYVREFRSQAAIMRTEWKRRAESSHLVRYEDLILHPEETLKGMFDYLGLDSSPEVIAEVLSAAGNTGKDAQKGHQTSAGGPAGSLARWKQDLDPALQQLCNECLGDMLASFGYSVKD